MSYWIFLDGGLDLACKTGGLEVQLGGLDPEEHLIEMVEYFSPTKV